MLICFFAIFKTTKTFLVLLGCFKSSRKFFSRYFFHEVPKETHNIFKDFEDEMTTTIKIFFRKFTLVPPYVHYQKINGKIDNSNFLYMKLYKTRTIILQSIVRHCLQPEIYFLLILHKGGPR
jgi:hypothetical protein